MAPSRAYVPSRALLRALSRPQPPRCPLYCRLPASFVRYKATVKQTDKDTITFDPNTPGSKPVSFRSPSVDTDEDIEKLERPLPDNMLDSTDIPTISWYEQDLDKGTPERLISKLETAEDRRKEKELYRMIEESEQNPDYDDAELNRRMIDSLIANPNFADLAEELEEIKAGIKSKEEIRQLEEQAAKEAEPEIEEFNASMRMATHEAIQRLIDDPELKDAKPELQEVLENMPEVDELDNPEFQAILKRATEKLESSEAFRQRMVALAKGNPAAEKIEKDWESFEKEVDEAFDPPKEDPPVEEDPEDAEDLDKLLVQMRDVMKSLGGDSQLQADLDAAINEDPLKHAPGDIEREVTPEELAEELKKLALAPPPEPAQEGEEKLDPELEAKIDKIMQDPKLMEKLMYIQQVVEEAQQNADITQIGHETAPDPETLDAERTTTLKERIQIAKNDPEHCAALKGLRVNLPPPFNISPALKTFNQAIEFAYVGANDDIRRILWRAYSKARVLPTFLQNVSDDAWDILYYSQAVTWGANQNRQHHLKVLLADLKSLGRDGPPTHPSSLVNNKGDAQDLEG